MVPGFFFIPCRWAFAGKKICLSWRKGDGGDNAYMCVLGVMPRQGLRGEC